MTLYAGEEFAITTQLDVQKGNGMDLLTKDVSWAKFCDSISDYDYD